MIQIGTKFLLWARYSDGSDWNEPTLLGIFDSKELAELIMKMTNEAFPSKVLSIHDVPYYSKKQP